MPDALSHKSIVLVVDGLRAAWLGPYGNTWFDTPAANQLAAESTIYPWCFSNSSDLDAVYHAFWRTRLQDQGQRRSSLLVSDCEQVLRHAGASSFEEAIRAPVSDHIEQRAPDVAATSLGVTLGVAMDALETWNDHHGWQCWIHAQGLAGPWDAPSFLCERLADQEDAEAPDWVEPPRGGSVEDPDQRFDWLLAAAAQVQAIDECLGWVMQLADQHEADLIVCGSRGYALGEHGSVGLDSVRLHGELLQTPLLARPAKPADCRRDGRFVQLDHVDSLASEPLVSSVDEFLSLPDPAMQLAVARADGQLAIRTAAWFARLVENSPDATELYSKPDDQFEVNEVADRCPAVVEAMHMLADRLKESAESVAPEPNKPDGSLKDGPLPLPEILWKM